MYSPKHIVNHHFTPHIAQREGAVDGIGKDVAPGSRVSWRDRVNLRGVTRNKVLVRDTGFGQRVGEDVAPRFGIAEGEELCWRQSVFRVVVRDVRAEIPYPEETAELRLRELREARHRIDKTNIERYPEIKDIARVILRGVERRRADLAVPNLEQPRLADDEPLPALRAMPAKVAARSMNSVLLIGYTCRSRKSSDVAASACA